MFIISIIIFIAITQQPVHDRLAENQPMAGLSSLNKNEYEYENGMGKSETELIYMYLSKNFHLQFSLSIKQVEVGILFEKWEFYEKNSHF